MLAYDIEPDFVSDDNFFDLKNIYGKLSSSKANKVIAFVDSCFSGMTDKNVLIKGVAATRLRARKVKLDKNKMVVLTAGKRYQYSNGYDKRGYRLFSYYVMKNIIEGKKDIKSLYKNIKKQTYQTSYEEYGDMRVQEPQIYGNKNFGL
jgi:5S rRNA maturation endonuclease (ribonuclease M5)